MNTINYIVAIGILIVFIKYYFDNEIIHRGSLYVELLNNRRTHVNLLIIISVINNKPTLGQRTVSLIKT